jgi:hypothetical protein
MHRSIIALALFCFLVSPLWSAPPPPEAPTGADKDTPEKVDAAPALPKDFAFTFSMPYGQGDEFPRDEKEFDRMLGLLKSAGYNTVHCPYEPWRIPLFKKHGMKIMIDVLAWKPPIEADIRRPSQRPKVKAMCLKIKDSDAVWGYNLWNERLDWCGNFKFLDAWVRMIRTWDPNHPIWVGTYRYLYCEHFPTHQGVCAWYDYHWSRGFAWNLHQLNFYRKIAAKRRSVMGKWFLIGDYNRNLYTLNTSIAHGVKVVLGFIGGPYAGREKDLSKRWDDKSPLIRIGRHLQPLYKLIGEIGMPQEVYATPTQRRPDTNKDKKLGMEGNTTAFPKDYWLGFSRGEVLAGIFKHPDGARVAYVCNHNAWAWQGATMDVAQKKGKEIVVSQFNRKSGKWDSLGARKKVDFALSPADAAVFRFETKPGAAIVKDTPVKWDPADNFALVAKIPAVGIKKGLKPAVSSEFGKDSSLAVKQGKAIIAVYAIDKTSDIVVFSNPSAIQWQGMLVDLGQTKEAPVIMSQFEHGKWNKLGAWDDVNFSLAPKGHTILKFERPGPAKPPAPKK